MNKFLLWIILLSAAAAIVSCAKKPEKGAWDKVFSLKIEHTHYYDGFSSETHGITVGYGGKCFYTEDGGKSWMEAVNESACRYGLDINGEKTAWNSGNGENINYTEDGGKSWKKAGSFLSTRTPDHTRCISFCDNQKDGWAASRRILGITNDGGKTWTQPKLPEGVSDICAIFLISPSSGYIFDCAMNKLFLTEDSAKTWSAIDLPAEAKSISTDNAPMSVINAGQNGRILFITNKAVKTEYQISSFVSADKGKTWKEEIIEADKGYLYLTKNGNLLTHLGLNGTTTLFRAKK
ncbi:MAG: hypothetical protein KAZ87_07680 [Spirochaetes bacterium]|nr:hypothetical protein [Spirochaetota bacterium]